MVVCCGFFLCHLGPVWFNFVGLSLSFDSYGCGAFIVLPFFFTKHLSLLLLLVLNFYFLPYIYISTKRTNEALIVMKMEFTYLHIGDDFCKER